MNDNLITPASILNCTTCISCGKERAIELYDVAGRPMRYQLMIGMNSYKSLDSTDVCVSHFKCNHCGARYNILWDNGVPKPLLTDTLYNTFTRDFTSGDGN